jgi:TP901 family phage tail tape measure protein
VAADFTITGDADVSNISSKLHQLAKDVVSSMAEAGKGIDGTSTNLTRLRYALYDVSSAASNVGQNLLNISSSFVGSSASFETAFTSVQRASQVTGDATGKLRDELLSLSREVPLAFSDITQIATLGAQLGVATSDLKQFSLTVAQFSSTTGMSVDSTAKAFGSLGELLNLSADQYANLGSSIAYAGVNAVATEAQIVSVATAIAGVGTQAGLSADYTIGLSTALASLQVPAEQSRGALTRIFQEINRAATIDPNAMDQFANVLGVTTAQANKLASTDMETFFNMFIDGMAKVSASGGPTAITAQLDALNLSDVRITNTVARLAGNTDLMKRSMSDASKSFELGTYLAESFALKADDLASKFTKLQNGLAELTAQMGNSTAPIVGMLTDLLTGLINALTDMAKTPAGATLAFLITTLSAVAGAALVAVGAVATLSASYLAMRVAAQEINKVGTENLGTFGRLTGSLLGVDGAARKTTGTFFGLTAASRQAAMAGGMENLSLAQQNALLTLNDIAARKGTIAQAGFGERLRANLGMISANVAAMSLMNKVMAAAGWIGLALTAVSLIQSAWESVANATKDASNENKKYAEQAFGSATGLAQAMAKDAAMGGPTINLNATASVVLPQAASTTANDYAAGLDAAADAQNNLGAQTDKTTGSIDAQTVAYGENTKKALADLLMQSEEFNKLIAKGGAIESLGGSSQKYVEAILGDPVNGAKTYIKSLTDNLDAQLKSSGAGMTISGYLEMYAQGGDLANGAVLGLGQALGISSEQAQTLISSLGSLDAQNRAVTGTLQESASATENQTTVNNALKESTNGVADATENAAGKLDEFKRVFDKAFGKTDGLISFASDLDKLITSLDASGKSFDQMTSNGASNLQNLRQALYSSVDAAKNLGLDAASGIGMVFAQLQKSGVDTATLLQQLQGMGGDYARAASGISVAIAGTYAGLTSAYNGMKNAYHKSTDSANNAAKTFRTAKDVANDFSSIANRAFEIRYGARSALDKIWEGWNNIKDAVKSARDQIDGLNRDITSLTADKALKEYFLSIAVAYGDTLSADKLRADLANINSEILKKQEELATATAAGSKTLKGNSKAAIDNRNTIRGMVTSYQSYIASLISSGASQATVNAAIASSREEFQQQAIDAGFAADELAQYTKSFDDMSKTNKNVDYSVSFNINGLDPAYAAIQEFKRKADEAAKNRTSTLSMSVDYAALAKWSRGMVLVGELTGLQTSLANAQSAGHDYVAQGLVKQIQALEKKLNSGNFASGGYTGSGSKYQPAGIVHAGEYVIPREQVNQTTGLPYFMNQPRSFAQMGYTGAAAQTGPMMVELSPYDRNLLAQAGNVQLRLDGRIVAQNTNANNTVAAQRGNN